VRTVPLRAGREREGHSKTMRDERTLPDLVYSRPETAVCLGISLRSVDRMIATKQIAVRRFGRRVLITADALAHCVKHDHKISSVSGGEQ
jgi:excisionase family DNA binding protein